MARDEGRELDERKAAGARPKSSRKRSSQEDSSGGTSAGEVPAGIPDAVRRLIALGLSGVFSTQESIRQAVGDALPKEWVDFAADQSERTRAEFLERLAGELARTIESIDLPRVMQQALEGRTLEVRTRIRMLPDEESSDGKSGGLRLSMTEDESS